MAERKKKEMSIRKIADILILVAIVFIIFPAWYILGKIEQTYMWIKGYDWDKGWGGYIHRKTGERIPSGW